MNAVMHEPRFIIHDGKTILLMELAGLTDQRAVDRFAEAALDLAQSTHERKSVLALMDLSGVHISRTTLAALKTLSANNGPSIRALAFVGLPRVVTIIARVFLRLTGRTDHSVLPDRERGIEWLMSVGQPFPDPPLQ